MPPTDADSEPAGASDQQLSKSTVAIGEFHLFGDDIAIEVIDERLGLAGRCVEDVPIGLAENQDVAECLALRAGDKRFAAPARRSVLTSFV